MATMSIRGLYLYDPSLFDDITIPSQLDRDLLVTRLVNDLAELEILYPDPEIMKENITNWSAIMSRSWQKMADVLYEDYDPFINIRRHEERTVTETRDLANSGSLSLVAWDESEPSERQSNTGTNTGTVITHDVYDLEGDSAITDAQDVARKEIQLRRDNEMYQIIINDFKKAFCLMVY